MEPGQRLYRTISVGSLEIGRGMRSAMLIASAAMSGVDDRAMVKGFAGEVYANQWYPRSEMPALLDALGAGRHRIVPSRT